MKELDDVVREFLIESTDNLAQMERDLLALEGDLGSLAAIPRIFRTLHTIKGTCGFLGFGRLESLAHTGENLLGKVRDGKLRVTGDIVSALLTLVDALRQILVTIEHSAEEGQHDFADVLALLLRLQDVQAPDVTKAPVLEQRSPAGDGRSSEDRIVVGAPLPPPDAPAALVDSTIRVDVQVLDRLMNLVGELVLVRNQILERAPAQLDPALASACQRLNQVTGELQEGVMKTRMQPIGTVWAKYPRLVRELARACGKDVRLEMMGNDTELDRSLIEAIKDPLLHLLRNAVGHGIESPEVRLARKKPRAGTLRMRAYHEGEHVHVEVADDGGGIDVEAVKRAAIERGILTAPEAAALRDSAALNLIFVPSLSTATDVTRVSGRGVGMDVVKTSMERIGGAVDVETDPGRGTTLHLTIPLTLAIIPALIVMSGGERFAIPQQSLLELVRLTGQNAATAIEFVHGAPVYRLRDRILPLAFLNRELGLESTAPPEGPLHIVVLQAEDRRFGFVVDAITDAAEIVVKPLGRHFRGIGVFAGATIMGDGNVALIIDVAGFAQRARLVARVREHALSPPVTSSAVASRPREAVLLAAAGAARIAVRASQVTRLEEFKVSAVERSKGREVVLYRGRIMPLVRVANLMNDFSEPASPISECMPVIVYSTGDREVGLVPDRVLDIVEITLPDSRLSDGPLTSMVIEDHVTELIDLACLLETQGAAGGELDDYRRAVG